MNSFAEHSTRAVKPAVRFGPARSVI
jgi:hypothetical protein